LRGSDCYLKPVFVGDDVGDEKFCEI